MLIAMRKGIEVKKERKGNWVEVKGWYAGSYDEVLEFIVRIKRIDLMEKSKYNFVFYFEDYEKFKRLYQDYFDLVIA